MAWGLMVELFLLYNNVYLPPVNFAGTVPALEYEEGKAIFDSNIVNAYLDEKYPEVALQSTNPLRRAEDKLISENFAGVRSLLLLFMVP